MIPSSMLSTLSCKSVPVKLSPKPRGWDDRKSPNISNMRVTCDRPTAGAFAKFYLEGFTRQRTNQQFSLALITGASSGIGAALSRLLAHQGIPLLMTARDSSRLNALADELRKTVPVTVLVADLTKTEERRHLIDKIHELTPDLLINNAGFGLYGTALSHETTENMNMVDLNVNALLELTLEGSKALVSSGKEGVILNISSSSDLLVFPGLAIYAASKAFVTQVSQSLDIELAPKGIRVLAACPGVVTTSFRQRAGSSSAPDGITPMSADAAADQLWKQIIKRKKIHYFDWKTRVALFFARHLIPQSVVSNILFKTVESYKKTRNFNDNIR